MLTSVTFYQKISLHDLLLKWSGKVAFLHFLQISLMSGQKRRQLDSQTCFSIQSITIHCFDWSVWRKLGFMQICPWKRKYLAGPLKGFWYLTFENHLYLDLCYAKCNPQTSRICIFWAHVKNVKFLPHNRQIESRHSFYKIQRWFMYTLKFEKGELKQCSPEVPFSSV